MKPIVVGGEAMKDRPHRGGIEIGRIHYQQVTRPRGVHHPA
jgi:hypothetical protein